MSVNKESKFSEKKPSEYAMSEFSEGPNKNVELQDINLDHHQDKTEHDHKNGDPI
jgi:hypothetical protein